MGDVTEDQDTGGGAGREAPAGSIVQSVETAFDVVETLRALDGGTVAEITAQLDLSKGAVYKHLTTLCKHGYAVKQDGEYRLGFRFLDYGGWLRSRYVGAERIKRQVRELAAETAEVAQFGIYEHDRVVTLFRENGSRGVFTRTRLGRRLYPHQTAGGKAMLSQFPIEFVRRYCARSGLPQATTNTITDEEALLTGLERIRERGYALNAEESTEGLVAVAVPLVPDGRVVGACSIAGPRHRLGDDRIGGEIAPTLLSAVNELELNITHAQEAVVTSVTD
jgi:DNA-binding IclR family transcriptional regulator